jgi:hypothetical protein
MASAGLSSREIARELGCSATYAARVIQHQGAETLSPVSVRAYDGRVVIETDAPQIVGVAIKRALERAGIEIVP